MKKIYNLLFILPLIGFLACSDDDGPAGPTNWPTPPGGEKGGIDKTYKTGDQLINDKTTLVWADEFDKDGLVDETFWSYEKGLVRNNEVQYYTQRRLENCKVSNGQLIITGRKEATPYEGSEFTSASIITNQKKSWKYGRFEIKAKVPSGSTGIWPAFWAKGDNQNTGSTWPACGEIDIMEYAAKNPRQMIQNIIYGKRENNVSKTSSHTLKYEANYVFSDDYHVYTLNWSSTQVSWAIDNIVTHVVDMTTIDAECAAKGYTNPFHQPFSILLNLALGTQNEGSLGGKFDPAVMSTPKEFIVDYVRVYQTSGAE